MPGTSASQMIFFIAAMIVATSVAGIFITTTVNLAKDLMKEAERQREEFNTHVTIINDESSMPYNSTCSTLVLYTMNTGSTVLNEQGTKILINGTYYTKDNMTFTLLDGATEWKNEVVLQITITNITLASGDYSLKVWVQGAKFAFLKSAAFSFKI